MPISFNQNLRAKRAPECLLFRTHACLRLNKEDCHAVGSLLANTLRDYRSFPVRYTSSISDDEPLKNHNAMRVSAESSPLKEVALHKWLRLTGVHTCGILMD
ncbi:hypothetical protein L798_13874 [Zootermopsis nevadensis]|uniref:Uncharacterized protein n=1 Tax=Zootermopsis nevadensis TaxID=136037 RepID=A0A067RV20_ZOONE|nr:hypothetical protein L798_13874 [Zootermopsis nevadensis]